MRKKMQIRARYIYRRISAQKIPVNYTFMRKKVYPAHNAANDKVVKRQSEFQAANFKLLHRWSHLRGISFLVWYLTRIHIRFDVYHAHANTHSHMATLTLDVPPAAHNFLMSTRSLIKSAIKTINCLR